MNMSNMKFIYQPNPVKATTKTKIKPRKVKEFPIAVIPNEFQKTTKYSHQKSNTFGKTNSSMLYQLNSNNNKEKCNAINSVLRGDLHKNMFNKSISHTFKFSPIKPVYYSPLIQKHYFPIVNMNENGFTDHVVNDIYKFYSKAKYSTCSNSTIMGYGTNTYKGLIRNYNEDRVSISLNIKCPDDNKWPSDLTISFFGIFDGHAGEKCSEYLKNNLHQFIIKDTSFPHDPIKAIQNAFDKAEKTFTSMNYKKKNIIDYSGSCAIIALIINNMCYIANVGDSRGLYSYDSGKEYFQITKDHKPNDPMEKKRIIKEGGNIYRTAAIGIQNLPWRILPGKLSVSRAIGDIEAKIPLHGGNPNVLIHYPSIIAISLDDQSDFIILGCDGIYDKLTNEEIMNMAWSMKKKNDEIVNINEHCGLVTDAIMKLSLKKCTVDNISCIFICFRNYMRMMKDTSFEYNQQNNLQAIQMKETEDAGYNNIDNHSHDNNNGNNVLGCYSNMIDEKQNESSPWKSIQCPKKAFLPMINGKGREDSPYKIKQYS